ncbi:MAG: serine/threonine-protein kinase [Myxococcaceae bacterium]
MNVRKQEGDDAYLVTVTGRIDESFPSAPPRDLSGVVIFDMSGVTHFTSFGVRKWLTFLSSLKVAYAGFINCRPLMTIQFNSVARFAGPGELISFFAPYVCPDCGKADELLVDLRKQHGEIRTLAAPAHLCSACNKPSELDDLPEAFFYYAANRPQPRPPPLTLLMIDGDDSRAGKSRSLRIQKDVQDTVTAVWLSGKLTRTARLNRIVDGLEGDVLVVPDLATDPTEDSLAGIRPLLELPRAEVYFARMPLGLVRDLVKGSGFGRAHLLSLMLPARCEKCRADDAVEFDVAQLKTLKSMCRVCKGQVASVLSSAQLDFVSSLPLAPAPPNVRAYLDAHGVPPSLDLSAEARARQGPAKYEIESRLGRGGMAEVFLARQRGAGGFEKKVVIKKILEHLANDHHFVEMFLSEAKLAARIDHPNVVQIFDVEEVAGSYLLAMEHVDGLDLAHAVRVLRIKQELIPIPIALKIVAEVCSGLHAAHTVVGPDGKLTPIIHRDVSPHNVLLSKRGVAKLSDFGIAKAAGTKSDTPASLVKGKFAYLAPEQVALGREASEASDLFAAGLVLYVCLTLEHPFQKGNEGATLSAIVTGKYRPATERRKEMPEEVDALLARAMAREPEERFTSGNEMSAAIEAILHKHYEPVTAAQLAQWVSKVSQDAEHISKLSSSQLATAAADDDGGPTPSISVNTLSVR